MDVTLQSANTNKVKQSIPSKVESTESINNGIKNDQINDTNGIKPKTSKVINGNLDNTKNNVTINSSKPNVSSEQNGYYAVRGITTSPKTPGTVPVNRFDLLKACGWGYKDTNIELGGGNVSVTSNRYGVDKIRIAEDVQQYVVETLGIDFNEKDHFSIGDFNTMPKPTIKKEFVVELEKSKILFSSDDEERRFRSHGQNSYELITMRFKIPFKRYVDLVVWPNCHEEVLDLVKQANIHNVVLVPFGGGTCVSKALLLDAEEKRMIVSLDTSQMNQMLWLDKTNMLARFQAGIIGQDLDRQLEKHGFVSGHQPDSNEFSSLGGWIATRASGMKKNKYGNIEDIVSDIRLVTPVGTLEKRNQAQRISCGPDFNHLVLGSEGTLGVVTEATIRVCPAPETTDYNSYVFPDLSSGIKFMKEVAKKHWQPASLRLVDNEQYKFGKIFKDENVGYLATMIENLKMFYLCNIKGVDEDKMTVAIAVFEGPYNEVKEQQRRVASVAVTYGGIAAGQSNGKRGYLLTFFISYLKDVLLDNWIMGESLETSVPWDRCELLLKNVKQEVIKKAKELGIKYCITSARISQVYDTGACIYIYIVYNFKGFKEPANTYLQLEAAALETIVSSGGSISHHHGIGKSKRALYPLQVSDMAVGIFKSIKKELDPKDIFAAGNLIPKK